MQRWEPEESSDGSVSEPSKRTVPTKRRRPWESSSEATSVEESSESESCETDSDESTSEEKQKPIANLLISQLSAFQDDAIESHEKKDSANAKSAMSKSRIVGALKRSCKCSMKCGKKLSYKLVLVAVQLFWAMSKSSQDALLWSLQQCRRHGEHL